MKLRESARYLATELALGLLFIVFMGFLEWHFIEVWRWGQITVTEKYAWILYPEAFLMVPLSIIFGLFKFTEDIILAWRRKRSVWYLFTELGVGLLFIASMGFIQYHFIEIVRYGESEILIANPWILKSLVLGAIPVWIIIGIYKFWEDARDLRRVKKKARL